MQTLNEHIERARAEGRSSVAAEDVFRLHDTFGFPSEMTSELLAEAGMTIAGDFDALMEEQRARGRASAGGGRAAPGGYSDEIVDELLAEGGTPTLFTGYETEQQPTVVVAARGVSGGDGSGAVDQRFLVKLAESPFYAAGGGQVSDAGTIACASGDCEAAVTDVLRRGDGQLVEVRVRRGALAPGEAVLAQVDRVARHATEANHTATHLLHAALRERLGTHVRQAGSYVGPDKLRFDFSHGQALTDQELADVADRVNEWVGRNDPVRPITTTLDEARRLGAMALFGEKYGDVVRMVEIGAGDYSRELCGGTHVRSTAEIGVFQILSETSSAANVRRIEAVTGPEAAALLRAHDRLLAQIGAELRVRVDDAPGAVSTLASDRKRLEKELAGAGAGAGAERTDLDVLAQAAQQVGGAAVLAAVVDAHDAKALLELADRAKGRLGDAAVLLGTVADGRVHLVASVAPALVERGVKAGAVVKAAAEIVGGGGGGRDTMAQAGGREPDKLDAAIEAGRAAIAAALGA